MTAAKKTDAAETADLELVRQLAERVRAEGLSLTGPGGLLNQVTKVVLESALEGEMDAHLGYVKHDPAGRDGGNSRNGRRPKTVVTYRPAAVFGLRPGQCVNSGSNALKVTVVSCTRAHDASGAPCCRRERK